MAPAADPDRSRLLIVAPDDVRRILRSLIAERLSGWDLVEAEGVDRARFALQMDPCDVLLHDGALTGGALDWFAEVRPLPVALLTDDTAFYCAAAGRGATYWLPRAPSLAHPDLLAAVLRRAAGETELRRQVRDTEAALGESRRQVNRLVNRLWEAVPSETGPNWFTQRHMLERLEEEVERVRRLGGPLTVVLGEVMPGAAVGAAADALATWAAEQVGRAKRRCDVAGQYGAHGFMLVLPRTAEPAAVDCCRRLRTLLEQPACELRGPLRACFGVAALEPDAGGTVTKLLRRAEERLEAAKDGGRPATS